MTNLHKKKCIACSGDMPALNEKEIANLNLELNGWTVITNQEGIKMITKYIKFEDFKNSLDFVNKLSAIAEQEGHHPDITFGWGYANVTIFTHAVKGLTESDFILAAKIDQISV
jgi:4a-hydroxytetrahydrobiopterin dehydratase